MEAFGPKKSIEHIALRYLHCEVPRIYPLLFYSLERQGIGISLGLGLGSRVRREDNAGPHDGGKDVVL